ncbi:MAG TPA: ATP12 family protein [Rhizomicrobium sp.]|nr:ATP12 family protein [Rhizomicrobium sp.]
MKRFYKDVSVAGHDGAFQVHLDGKPLKTPSGVVLAIPARALAEAVAREWHETGATFDPQLLPLTRLAFAAAAPAQRARIVEQLIGFGRSDLLCYRAEAPAALVARQAAAWDLLLDWVAETHGARLTVTSGIKFVPQPEAALRALEVALEKRDDFSLAAIHAATPIAGSLVIGLALADGRLDAAEAFAAAHLDESFQAEQWGRDTEAEERLAGRRSELEAAERFLRLL